MKPLTAIGLSLTMLIVRCGSDCVCDDHDFISKETGKSFCTCVTIFPYWFFDPTTCSITCTNVETKKDALELDLTKLPSNDVSQLSIQYYKDTELPGNFLKGKTISSVMVTDSITLKRIDSDTFAADILITLLLGNLTALVTINPGALKELKNLMHFNINNCASLKQINFDFAQNSRLRWISVSGTAAETMSEPMMPTPHAQVALDLRHSKFLCDCSMKWLVKQPWKSLIIDCEQPRGRYDETELSAGPLKQCTADRLQTDRLLTYILLINLLCRVFVLER